VTQGTRVIANEIEQAYRDQGDRLYYALLAYTGDRGVASEAVAEAFARALAAASSIREIEPWLWRVAFRVAAADLKHRRRMVAMPEERTVTPEPREVVQALAHLSERQRAAVILHYYAGYSLDEIAAILGTRKGTIGVHLHRARARLRELLEEEDG
jgi:RNA polymerase sigma-70 factor (ECF subfamily)